MPTKEKSKGYQQGEMITRRKLKKCLNSRNKLINLKPNYRAIGNNWKLPKRKLKYLEDRLKLSKNRILEKLHTHLVSSKVLTKKGDSIALQVELKGIEVLILKVKLVNNNTKVS